MALNERIEALLKEHRISRSDLSRIWGKPRPRVNDQLDKGSDTNSLSFIVAVKKATNVSYSYIIDGQEDQVVKDYYEKKMQGMVAEPESKYGEELVEQLKARVEDLKKLCTMLEDEVAKLKHENREEIKAEGERVGAGVEPMVKKST